jgi:biopolymer transport protein ExbB
MNLLSLQRQARLQYQCKAGRRWLTLTTVICMLTLGLPAFAAVDNANSTSEVNDLYEQIRSAREAEAKANHQREARFMADKDAQKAMLDALKKEYAQLQLQYDQLQAKVEFSDNEIATQQQRLTERTHNLKDLFAAWRQVSTDTLANQKNSLNANKQTATIAQLQQMVQLKGQPDSTMLNTLSHILQQDILATGKISTYSTQVTQVDGTQAAAQVESVGPFTATSNGKFLHFDSNTRGLSVAPRQPEKEYLQVVSADSYQQPDNQGVVLAVIDPSRGVVLNQLALAPSLVDRLKQGGIIGYAIITLGVIGLLLALWRWLSITRIKMSVRRQLAQMDKVDLANPLGRILQAYHQSQADQGEKNTEALEVRLQEIVLEEMPRLDKGLGALKLLAAVAPLLGLLGTVVGMINTFQTITLVGAADPKLMAGGISQALMTTVLGLLVAVPLLFSHSLVNAKSRALMIFLSQQSLGFIGRSLTQTEKSDR